MSELAVTSALQLHVPVPGDATPMTAPAVSLDAMPTAELVIARAWKLGLLHRGVPMCGVSPLRP